jgi:hypothetical protein
MEADQPLIWLKRFRVSVPFDLVRDSCSAFTVDSFFHVALVPGMFLCPVVGISKYPDTSWSSRGLIRITRWCTLVVLGVPLGASWLVPITSSSSLCLLLRGSSSEEKWSPSSESGPHLDPGKNPSRLTIPIPVGAAWGALGSSWGTSEYWYAVE